MMKSSHEEHMPSLRDSNYILSVFLGLKSQAITCHRSAVRKLHNLFFELRSKNKV